MKVSVVLDIAYGERVLDLAKHGPVWIVESPVNRNAAELFWSRFPDRNHLSGITIFTPYGRSAEEWFLNEIEMIDLHHGVYSSDPPYQQLVVHGCPLSESICARIRELGLILFEGTNDGFSASRAAIPI